ncbi:PAS domain-containing protein [Paenibacillus sp.]|uniref:PAS domain-containing protein n=1 Tax=Paenibacillus sp. TaxID=58172 RepID=UPI002823B277|nr:PAS domain-containing protein [Paenibacillus sp.]MDR0269872.1 PAS domain-containing protein [Paenibacillus sp.]
MHNSGITFIEIIDSLKQAVGIVDSKGSILSVNRAWIQNSLEGGIPESFIWTGVNFMQIYSAFSETDAKPQNELDSVLDGTSPFFRKEIHCFQKQKMKWFSLEVSTVYDDNGHTVKGMVVCFTDITKSKLLEHDLMEALTQIRTLRGLLPICAVCKKIRDEHDIWNTVESFLEKHTHAEFTHDICPECIRRLYPKYSSILDGTSCS